MAAGDLCTLAALKAWLGLTATTDDALLSGLITAASTRINAYLQRNIGTLSQSYTEIRNGTGTGLIMAKMWPITAWTSVAINGATVPQGLQGSAGWYGPVWDGLSYPIPEPYIGLSSGFSLTYPNGGYRWGPGCWNGWFPPGLQNVQLIYVAGFAAIPADISQACIELVDQIYRRRMSRLDVKSQSAGQETTSYEMKMLPSVREMLSPYRRVAPLLI